MKFVKFYNNLLTDEISIFYITSKNLLIFRSNIGIYKIYLPSLFFFKIDAIFVAPYDDFLSFFIMLNDNIYTYYINLFCTNSCVYLKFFEFYLKIFFVIGK